MELKSTSCRNFGHKKRTDLVIGPFQVHTGFTTGSLWRDPDSTRGGEV